uniref:Proteophosphoglycan 5 n=1 Tax=Moniliophthora roreri TaxID=221103 RepID=A0A0W0EX34_MONRR
MDAHSPEPFGLREYIHDTLYNYATEHLVFSYVEFTEQAILSQCLHQVPFTDSFSLRPPPEPFEVLKRVTKLNASSPYQEPPERSPAALEYIKRELTVLKSGKGQKPRSERAAYTDEDDDELYFQTERLFHISSRRSKREVPQPGRYGFLRSLPKSPQSFLLRSPVHLKPATAATFEEEVLQNPDRVLNTNWNLTPEMLTDVSALLKSTAALSRYIPDYKNQYLDIAFREDSQPPPSFCGIAEREFTPMFPRSSRPGFGRTVRPGKKAVSAKIVAVSPQPKPIPPNSMEVLAANALRETLVKEFKEEEKEQFKQNMVVVNGWQTYSSSPSRGSSTSTPNSSQDDQIDELQLFTISSPDTSPTLVKMELPAIARSNRIGGVSSRAKPKSCGAGKSLAAFLLNALPAPSGQAQKLESELNEDPAHSLIGEPPSAKHDEASLIPGAPASDDEVLLFFPGEDPQRFILDEKLDVKTATMMDVPRLPPPNEHAPNELPLPKKLSDLILPNKRNHKMPGNDNQCSTRRLLYLNLRKAKGTQAATLAVSWIPFTVAHQLPSHMEMVGVTAGQLIDRDDIKNGISREQMDERVTSLLNVSLEPSGDSNNEEVWERIWNTHLDKQMSAVEDLDNYDIVLTREERRRLAGLETTQMQAMSVPMEAEEQRVGTMTVSVNAPGGEPDIAEGYAKDYDDGSSDKENEDPSDHHKPVKRIRFSEQPEDTEADTKSPVNDACPWNDADDSGVAFGWDEPIPARIREEHEGSGPGLGTVDDMEDVEKLGFIPVNTSQLQSYTHARIATHADQHLDTCLETLDPLQAASPLALHSRKFGSAEPVVFTFNESSAPDSVPPAIDHLHIAAGIAEFARLRAKKLSSIVEESKESQPLTSQPVQAQNSHTDVDSNTGRDPPQDIYTQDTIHLPSTWTIPSSAHWYMASMDLIQKQCLVRSLRSENCAIGLMEREGLGGVDLILDPHTAIIFSNLSALPAGCDSLVTAVSEQSQRYSRLFVIFEAYPPSMSFKCNEPQRSQSEALNPYSPPVLKAIKKFRRDLNVAEACGTKSAECVVYHTFARDVEQAATFARHFGDLAEASNESESALWGDRSWLEADIPEDEEGMAIADGMNHFAAFVILCQVPVQEFLNMHPDERSARFGPYVGNERLATLNRFIEKRLQVLESSEPDVHQ